MGDSKVIDESKLEKIVLDDIVCLLKAERSYGDSWKRRGGAGAFMMLARKWDRIENQVTKVNYDIFAAYLNDKRKEGILDDIQDLRRYLILVEDHLINGDEKTLFGSVSSTRFSLEPDPVTRAECGCEACDGSCGYVNQD